VSTLGSFVGTILIGYVLIPFLPNSFTMFLTAALLAGVSAAYFFLWERRGLVPVLAGAATLALFGYLVRRENEHHFSEVRELYCANSNFGLVQVVENKRGDRRFYLNDYLVQDIYDPHEKKSLALFTYALHDLAVAYTPRIEKVLCIGLGVGIVPAEFAKEGVAVDVIEINPAVAPVAAQLFNCDLSRFRVIYGDGRWYMNQCTNQYDVVLIDAFLGDSSPSHLMTRQAFEAVHRLLRPQGVLVMNAFGDFEDGKDFMTASLDKTLRRVFPGVHIHASGNGNVFFVASARPDLQIQRQPDFERIHSSCRAEATAAFNGIVHADPDHGIVLSDDYNPVEFYDAAAREEHRRRLALHMRTL
jgi:spermidine synthase